MSYKWVGIKDRCKKHRETHLHRHAERKMKTSTVLTISFVLFLVLATLCRNSEGFALSLTARRDELKRNKKKQASDGVRLRRKLKRLKNKELELERKVSELSKWVQKYKTTHRSKSKQGRFSGADSWWNLWTQRMTMFTLARNWKIECQLKKDLDKMLFISRTLFEKRKSLASSECYLFVHGKSEVIQWLSIYNKYIFWYSFKDVVFATSCQL